MKSFLLLLAFLGAGLPENAIWPPSQSPSPGLREGESGKPQQPRAREGQISQPDNRGTVATPLIVEMKDTPKAEAQAAEAKKQHDEETAFNRWANEWTIGLSGGLVFVGLLQGFVLLYTALVTNKAANAAQVAAEALPILERAYLFLDGPMDNRVIAGTSTGIGSEAQFCARNSGRTPGTVRRLRAQLDIFSDYPQDMEGVPEIALPRTFIVAAGDVSKPPSKATRTFSQTEITSAKNGSARILFIGAIDYTDIFGQWTVTFCREFDFTQNQWVVPKGTHLNTYT